MVTFEVLLREMVKSEKKLFFVSAVSLETVKNRKKVPFTEQPHSCCAAFPRQ